MSNKLFKLFRSKKNKHESDELDKFIKIQSNQENERPVAIKYRDPLDLTATACYHTDVAPRTKRGPKSLPPTRDDYNGGIINRSFETEVGRPRDRRRAASPDYENETRRHRSQRQNAFSEFNGPVSRRKDIEYRKEFVEESEDENEDIASLRHRVKKLNKALAHNIARKNQYKQEMQTQMEIRRSIEMAFKNQENNYLAEIAKLKNDNTRMAMQVQNGLHKIHSYHQDIRPTQSHFHNPYPFTYGGPPSNQFAMRESVVADPLPTRTDLFPMNQNFMQMQDFQKEDQDETKVFKYGSMGEDFSETHDSDTAPSSHLQME